jgi:hypothetical protein
MVQLLQKEIGNSWIRKIKTTIQSSNSTQKNWKQVLKQRLVAAIPNSPKVKTTHISINW